MSDKGSQSSKKDKRGKRKVKELDSEPKKDTMSKRLRSASDKSDSDEEVTETQLVPYNKKQEDSSSDEENKYQIIPFATDISANPLSTYNTFVCHLGNWKDPLTNYLKHPQFRSIFDFVKNEYDMGTCFPPKNLIFNAFQRTPFDKVKVVMLGAMPSVKLNEAMGLSFSVPRSTKCPPVLENIYKALVKDPKVDFTPPSPLHGDLESWANQGILMLNNSLTTREGEVSSHAKAGWKKFTKAILAAINKEKEGVIFLSWGGQAQKILKDVDKKKHYVLNYGNPSPLSQKFQKFEDCTNFSKVNEILREEGLSEINWNLD